MTKRICMRLMGSALVAGVLSALTAGAAHAGATKNHNETLER